MIVDSSLPSNADLMPRRLDPRVHAAALATSPAQQQTVQVGAMDPPLLALLRYWLKPAVVALVLFGCIYLAGTSAAPPYSALALVAVVLARQLFSPLDRRGRKSLDNLYPDIFRLTLEWSVVVAALVFLGSALRLGPLFDGTVLLSWFALTPVLVWIAAYGAAASLSRIPAAHRRHIIIGANEAGEELARRVAQSAGNSEFMGYFDFRSLDRLPERVRKQCAGTCEDVAAFVRHQSVQAIYIALPMSRVPRIDGLLREFRDTTASVYFVPDIFAFDLIQARCVDMNGIPLLSICDTPFHGTQALQKRLIDALMLCLLLPLCCPLMLLIALVVRLTSAGPVLFRQRRYGLDGQEIVVLKFRTMNVCEDGASVIQAQREDSRLTAVGGFLRRTSLDELPQLFNVLQGKMSFVGPRPHAVAHNEIHRRLINGYMIRHKVRPGMSGWAQIHGLRGETTTGEQMRLRVQYDLEYLRNWSVWLELKIIVRTVLIVFSGRNAY
jgi:putative colanic acid biosynthesis UDP-glucose lipid carrier transferase